MGIRSGRNTPFTGESLTPSRRKYRATFGFTSLTAHRAPMASPAVRGLIQQPSGNVRLACRQSAKLNHAFPFGRGNAQIVNRLKRQATMTSVGNGKYADQSPFATFDQHKIGKRICIASIGSLHSAIDESFYVGLFAPVHKSYHDLSSYNFRHHRRGVEIKVSRSFRHNFNFPIHL